MFDQVLNAPLNRYSKIETKTLQSWAEGCTGYISNNNKSKPEQHQVVLFATLNMRL